METPENEQETYITVKEASERLGIDRTVIIRALNSGKRGLRGKQVIIELQPRPVWMIVESSLKDFQRGAGGKPTHKKNDDDL